MQKQILMVNPDNRLTWLKGLNYYQVNPADRYAPADFVVMQKKSKKGG